MGSQTSQLEHTEFCAFSQPVRQYFSLCQRLVPYIANLVGAFWAEYE